jgi:hypothetical protein
MFNLFEGGKKGRLFNNSARGGEGGSKVKKKIVSFVAILGALVLVGWGCGQRTATPTDTGTDTSVSETTPEMINEVADETSAGTQTYQSGEWGVIFTYPGSWQYHEYRETVEGEEIVTLVFSDQELPEAMPPEPLFPIMVTRDSRTVNEVAAVHTDAVSTEDSTLGGRLVKVITRYSDILEANYRIYVVPLRTGSMQFVPLDARYIPTAEDMIANLTETE